MTRMLTPEAQAKARPHRPIPPLSAQDKERFWSKIDVREPDECWEWQAYRDRHGYGGVCLGSQKNGSRGMFAAHRVAWTIANGPIPPRLCLLHSCDNPPCCNPAHGFLGTKADNNHDALKKGRQVPGAAYGELNGQTKLTGEDVRDIRRRHARGEVSMIALARELGVHKHTIGNIIHRRTWAHTVQRRTGVTRMNTAKAQAKRLVSKRNAKSTYKLITNARLGLDATQRSKIAARLLEMPQTCRRTYLRALAGHSRAAAIKAFCLECVAWRRRDVARCEMWTCPLYPYRPFKREG